MSAPSVQRSSGIDDDDIAVRAHEQRALARVEREATRGVLATDPGELVHESRRAATALAEHERSVAPISETPGIASHMSLSRFSAMQ